MHGSKISIIAVVVFVLVLFSMMQITYKNIAQKINFGYDSIT